MAFRVGGLGLRSSLCHLLVLWFSCIWPPPPRQDESKMPVRFTLNWGSPSMIHGWGGPPPILRSPCTCSPDLTLARGPALMVQPPTHCWLWGCAFLIRPQHLMASAKQNKNRKQQQPVFALRKLRAASMPKSFTLWSPELQVTSWSSPRPAPQQPPSLTLVSWGLCSADF
nr:uncharacterized protein LOC109029501 [Gorilla gorilla gorilla]